MYCPKCGAQNQGGGNFCPKCGFKLRQAASMAPAPQQKAMGGGSHGDSQNSEHHGNGSQSGNYQNWELQSSFVPSQGHSPLQQPSPVTEAEAPSGFFDRYDDGGIVIFTCIAGLITALLALFTFSGTWVTIKPITFLMTRPLNLTFVEFAEFCRDISGFMQYFNYDQSTATALNIAALAASISNWLLPIGAVVSIIASITVLLQPKAELLIFVPYVVIIAFAVVGLVFTALMVLMSDIVGVTPYPIVMLIVAGVPAVLFKVIG